MQLLATKLHRPPVPARLVPRPVLIERLTAGVRAGCSLTLVSAPAGFGKSTFVCEWLEKVGAPAAWLSLDPSDDDPPRFLAYLGAALRQVDAVLGQALAGAPEHGPLPPLPHLVTELLAGIQAYGRPFFLVLDDFHVIHDPEILSACEMLLAHQPPPMRLVLVSREDPQLPLARLRANHRLQEVRAEDLRFSSPEADTLMQALGLNLSGPDLAVLLEKTEGWVAGLQLAALAMQGSLSLRGRPDPAEFVRRLSGTQRYILSYLTEEVLNRQPEDVRQFLLQTAILDRLSGDLCDAVTGRTDSAAVLAYLQGANLFLIPLEDGAGAGPAETWFRYHHLFAELLVGRLKQLQGRQTAELYRRASRWFEQRCGPSAPSERPGLAGEAIRYAIAGEDYPAAVRLIETYVVEMVNQWYARLVSRWLAALPPAWSARSPRANLACARLHLMQGDFSQAQPYVARLEALFSGDQAGDGEPALKAEYLALQSTLTGAQGRPAAALALAQEAAVLVQESDLAALSQVYLALAVAYQQMGDLPRAVEAYQRLIELGRQSGTIVTELMGLSALALLAIQRGQLRQAYQLAAQGAARVERLGYQPPICAGIYGELGQICFHWGQFDQAEQYFQQAVQVTGPVSFSDTTIFQAVARSRLALIRGDLALTEAEIRKAADLVRGEAPVVVREEVIAQQIHLLLAQGNLSAAELVLYQETGPGRAENGLTGLLDGNPRSYARYLIPISALRIAVHKAVAQGLVGAGEAVAFAGRLLLALRERGFVPLALETLLLRAQLHAALGDDAAGLADLASAVDLAEPEGYLSLFALEGPVVQAGLRALLSGCEPAGSRTAFIRRVLGLFPTAPQPHAGGLPEPLTAREMEVLGCMTAGQTYEEIAARLVVSINTVRTHVKSIYGKLGVNNRTAAIEAARRRSLL